MPPVYDILDSMMYSIVASGVLMGIAFLRLPYQASTDSFGEENKNLRRGLAVTMGANGLYLFLAGVHISFNWVFTFSGGIYNIIFGSAALLGGLVLLTIAASLFMNGGLKPVSYFAAVVGAYLAVLAYAIFSYNLTSSPLLSTLLYLAPAVTSFVSVPATHIENKWIRRVFAVFALLFAIAWFYFAANVTLAHTKPA